MNRRAFFKIIGIPALALPFIKIQLPKEKSKAEKTYEVCQHFGFGQPSLDDYWKYNIEYMTPQKTFYIDGCVVEKKAWFKSIKKNYPETYKLLMKYNWD